MNGYAVQDAWIKHAQRDRVAEGAARRTKARALLAKHAADLAGDDFAVMAVVELWSRHGEGNVSGRMVREYLAAYHQGRFERGWIDELELQRLVGEDTR